jgi:hypothetical protein
MCEEFIAVIDFAGSIKYKAIKSHVMNARTSVHRFEYVCWFI